MQRNTDLGPGKGQAVRYLAGDEDEVHVRRPREHHLLGRGLHRPVHLKDCGAWVRRHADGSEADLACYQQLLQIVLWQLLQRARSAFAHLWIIASPKQGFLSTNAAPTNTSHLLFSKYCHHCHNLRHLPDLNIKTRLRSSYVRRKLDVHGSVSSPSSR